MAKVKELISSELSGAKEVIDYSLYDSLKTSAGAENTLTFFQNTVGSVGRSRTNMKQAGQLPSPWSFLITALYFEIMNADGTPFTNASAAFPTNKMAATGHYDIVVDPSTKYEGHLSQLMSPVHSETITDSAAATHKLRILATGRKKFRFPIVIPPVRSFSLKLTVTTPAEAEGYTAANTLIFAYMEGIMYRNK